MIIWKYPFVSLFGAEQQACIGVEIDEIDGFLVIFYSSKMPV